MINERDFDEIKFWGRLWGKEGFYYVLVAYWFREEYEFPAKWFYYSDKNFDFKVLPNLNLEFKVIVD